MSQRILILPNTMQQACAGIDELSDLGMLSAPASLLLKALYAHGWDDGVVCLNAEAIKLAAGLNPAALDLAIYELLSNGLIRIRTGAQSDVVEIVALATLEMDVWSKLAWWHYCLIEGDEAA